MRRPTAQSILHRSRLAALRSSSIALLTMLFVACAQLPQLQPVDNSAGRNQGAACLDVFPTDSWRLVHAIETAVAGRPAGVVVGVTVIKPGEHAVEAVIMTLEGLVLFHARRSENGIEILRAIAPFDSPRFAKGLIADVTLLFLPPEAVKATSGLSAGGDFTCRYIRADASAVDIVPGSASGWKLLEYDRRAHIRRRVTAHPQGDCPSDPQIGLPCRIELEAIQRPAYTLRMSLIEAERVTP